MAPYLVSPRQHDCMRLLARSLYAMRAFMSCFVMADDDFSEDLSEILAASTASVTFSWSTDYTLIFQDGLAAVEVVMIGSVSTGAGG